MRLLYPLILSLLTVFLMPQLQAQSCSFISANVDLAGAAHDDGFMENDQRNTTALLSNGNFVVAWETRDDVDGNENGGFFRVFNASGTAVTDVIIPYLDINPMGIGDQGTFGPKVVALTAGFVIAWESAEGPGDEGERLQDVFFRVYDNGGNPVSGATRISIAGEEDHVERVLPLSGGGFVILHRIDEDTSIDGSDNNNRDDYFFQAFNASGVATSGNPINISGGLHDEAFQEITALDQAMIALDNNNFAIAWEARNDIDGNGTGAFFRIFNADGTALTPVVMPYADINAAGTGDQGRFGPQIIRLAGGNFVVGWESRGGPGDLGTGGDGDQDAYFRVYNATGTAVSGTVKANSDNTAEEENLDNLLPLAGGNFAVVYHNDLSDPNTDDYFTRVFNAGGSVVSSSLEVSGGLHTGVDCFISNSYRNAASLTNGNYVIGWSATGDSDGDGTGGYYRVFSPMGTAVTAVITPYSDINPSGTGNQASGGPHIEALPAGFAVAWPSEQGPTDVGPGDNDQQDVYHRVSDNNGMLLCGSMKTNTDNDAAEEILESLQVLDDGNFVVLYKDDEDGDNGGNNKDDYYLRVIGGAPDPLICPTIGTVSAPATNCPGESFTVIAGTLNNLAAANNNEQDYGITFVASAMMTTTPYVDATVLGTVAFEALTNDGTTAILDNVTIDFPEGTVYIYAILNALPEDSDCRPFAEITLQNGTNPTVSFTAPDDLMIDVGVQSGLGGGTPAGGVYSGPGVSDDGNGTTYSFDPMAAGVGTHTIIYTVTSAEGCVGDAMDDLTVTAAPLIGDMCADAVDISSLFGQMPLVAQISAGEDNTGYTTDSTDPSTGFECHFESDPLQNTSWYAFVGDGNRYLIRTIVCDGSPDNLDLQAAVYSGSCDSPLPVVCNEDENGAESIFNVAFELDTEVGVTYLLMLDGYTGTAGAFCLEVTNLTTVEVTDLSEADFRVYPNPTEGFLQLPDMEMERVEIYDATGRLNDTVPYSPSSIDLSTLPSGMYHLKIYTKNATYSTRVIRE